MEKMIILVIPQRSMYNEANSVVLAGICGNLESLSLLLSIRFLSHLRLNFGMHAAQE